MAEEAEPIEEYRLEDEINKMKYACIKDRWDDTDATVQKYIDELTQAKYEDADTLYNRLHGFKLVNLFFTNSRNGTSHLASIDKKSMIVCRFDVVKPLSSTDTTHISYKIALPNGVTLISAPSDVTFKDGQNGYWSWRAGSYNDVYGFGTLTITFFNEYKDVIGQASVEITE